jgi:hypothetical protein
MSFEIRQGTAVVLSFGPFVAPSDGVTLVTSLVSALDNATTGIMLSKNGGANAVRHATVATSIYDSYGMYRVTLDTTDTATLGTLKMSFASAASCIPVWIDLSIISQSTWDAKYSTGNYPAAINSINSSVDFSTTMKGNLAATADIATAVTTSSLTSIKRNTAFPNFTFKMRNAITHIAVTGATVSVARSIDGGAFSVGALSSVTEISNGLYRVNFSNSDLDGRSVVLRCSALDCETIDIAIYPVG